jgi:hypothetical protein
MVRRRLRDNAVFIAIDAVLALLFLPQFGWVIVHQSHA